MTETTDEPICGYEFAEGGICTDPRTGARCDKHGLSVHSVCSGCGGPAFRECAQELSPGHLCRKALCLACGHSFEDDSHAPITDSMLRPEYRTELPKRDVPQGIHDLRKDLMAATARILTQAQKDGKISFTGQVSVHELAVDVVDGLSTHTALMALSAVAMAVPTE